MSDTPTNVQTDAVSSLSKEELERSAHLEKVMDFAFLEVLANQRVKINALRGGLACS